LGKLAIDSLTDFLSDFPGKLSGDLWSNLAKMSNMVMALTRLWSMDVAISSHCKYLSESICDQYHWAIISTPCVVFLARWC